MQPPDKVMPGPSVVELEVPVAPASARRARAMASTQQPWSSRAEAVTQRLMRAGLRLAGLGGPSGAPTARRHVAAALEELDRAIEAVRRSALTLASGGGATPRRARRGRGWDLASTLAELVPDAVLVADERGRVELANARAEEIFRLPADLLLGTPVDRLVPAAQLGAPRLRRAGRATATPASSPPVNPELGRGRDGARLPIEVVLKRMRVAGSRRSIVVARAVGGARPGDEAADACERAANRLQEEAIGRLLRAAMTLQSAIRLSSEPAVSRLSAAVRDVDEATREIRGAILEHRLASPPPEG